MYKHKLMERRKFIKGSALFGMTLAVPEVLKDLSGMITGTSYRKVYKILNADRTTVGTLPILRAFAGDHLDYVSPYVLFDEFGPVNLKPGNKPLRVNAHPHAGIVPTTYFLSGSGHHKDSLNYDFQVGKGEFMMFSSGKGAIHMEETGKQLYDEGGNYHGFQIWLNMPKKYKFTDPATYVHKGEAMGKISNKHYHATVVLGELNGAKSKIATLSPAFYYHITLLPNGKIEIPVDPTHNIFVYAVKGEVELEGQQALKTNQVALFQRGENLVNIYGREGAELLVLGGQPLNEPVFSYGPFVMNTEEEIRKVVNDYNTGKMGNPDLVNQ
jgi:redox-sensitive bicupin YhaK (pirin superfamily)